jgi:hypothetical protein
MLSDYQSFVDYVSLTKCGDDDIQFDTARITEIRDKFEELHYGKSKIDDYLRKETVKTLMDELKIIDDQTNFEYVDLVVQQDSDNGIKTELIDKFIPFTGISEPTTAFANVTTTLASTLPTTTSASTPLLTTTSVSTPLRTTTSASTPLRTTSITTTPKKPKSQQLIESQPEIVKDIICIIHKKSPPRVEIDEFFQDFLFLKIQPPE